MCMARNLCLACKVEGPLVFSDPDNILNRPSMDNLEMERFGLVDSHQESGSFPRYSTRLARLHKEYR